MKHTTSCDDMAGLSGSIVEALLLGSKAEALEPAFEEADGEANRVLESACQGVVIPLR